VKVNALLICGAVAVDFCATMAAGHAQKGAKGDASNGATC